LASIRKAAELGCRWVEFDVMLTGDDVPVLFHDDKLARTTGAPGLMAEQTLAETLPLDAGAWFSEAFRGEPIPTLVQALELLADLRLGAVIEIKPSSGRDDVTGRETAKTLKGCKLERLPGVLVSSFNPAALATFRRVAPEFPLAFNAFDVPANWGDVMKELGCGSFHCLARKLREKTAREIIDAGFDLRCFTVNNALQAKKLFRWGAASVFSDFPERILKLN